MQVVEKQVFVKSEQAGGKSIGARSRELIKEGHSNAVILATIREEFPQGKTTAACIAWYKSDMRKKGQLAPRGHVEKTVYLVVGEDGKEREATKEEIAEYLTAKEETAAAE
jgi:hypothetical protein